MAEHMRGRPDEEIDAPGGRSTRRPPTTDPERLLPEEAEAAHRIPEYDDPEHARSQIEATRSRMSETIDEIEESILRKKQRVQERLDVRAPIRENPWRTMGIALGSGFLLGLLTAGGEEEEEIESTSRTWTRRRHQADTHWKHRAAMLERRSRRLVRIAREQEEELERMRRQQMRLRRGRAHVRSEGRLGGPAHEPGGSVATRFEELRDAVLAQFTDLIGRGSRRFTGGRD